VPGTSSLILSFPLSSAVRGGSGTAGFTKTVFEVEGASEEGATSRDRSCQLGALLDRQHTSQLLISDSF
jgi:hypothetical protein